MPMRAWRSTQHRRSGLSAALASVLVVMVVTGCVGDSTDTSEAEGPSTTAHHPEDSTPPSPPSTTMPNPTGTTRPEQVKVIGPWTRHYVPTNPTLNDVAAGGFGFVATGWRFGVNLEGGIWFSPDGVTWEEATGGVTYADQLIPSGTLVHDSHLIVWGENHRSGGTVVWKSEDGQDWDLITTGEPPLDGAFATGGLSLESGGYLLYGRGSPSVQEPQTRIFYSPDGSTWERIETPVEFSAMVELDGTLIANGGEPDQRTAWTSEDDGHTWTLHATDQPTVNTMIDTPHGLVAAGVGTERVQVGDVLTHVPLMWISQDGATFTETARLPIGADTNTYVKALAVVDTRLVAVGYDHYPKPIMWVSDNGLDWQEVDLESWCVGGGTLMDITARDSVVITVGTCSSRAVYSGTNFLLLHDTEATH